MRTGNLVINNAYYYVQIALSFLKFPRRYHYCHSPVRYRFSSSAEAKAKTSLKLPTCDREDSYFYFVDNYSTIPIQINVHIRNRMESTLRAENRLRYYIYCFYIGGIPLFNKTSSILYHMFVLFCYACAYSTIIALFMAIYHHRDDLDNVINVSMLFLVFLSGSCTQLYFR
jgi:hypothetical protein